MNKLLKTVLKNIGASLVGALIGLILSLLFTAYIWIPIKGPEIGLAIIGLAPVIFIMFGIIGTIIGAILGLIIYQTIKRYKK